MRAYIVLLALTVFVVAVSAGENKPEDEGKGSKKEIRFIHNFFYDDPIGKQIAQLAKNWNKTAPKTKNEIWALLAKNCKGLKNKSA
uniref:8 kDa glycoprotein n=1 Tax=Taenia multiceps TaxID=94034 RepID=B6E471_TAEMU|nr:8 kDa glycoprotein [Taenia multiceps]